MRISDFRQYRGEHSLSFSFAQDKSVTVVTGKNGAGKTALFYALNWVLYGDADLHGSLVNKGAAQANPLSKAWVQLEFFDDSYEWVARREVQRTITGQERETSFSLNRLDAEGRIRQVPNPQEAIDTILPADARRYFFFDGERIDELTRPGHESQVREAARSVLNLKVFERTVEHLSAVARDYGRQLKAAEGVTDEQRRMLERTEATAATVAENEAQLVDVRERVAILQGKLDAVNQQLDDLKEIRALQARDQALRLRKATLSAELTKLRANLRTTVSRSASILATDAIGEALRILEAKRVKGEIPSGLRQQFVDDLLRDGICICGRHIDDDARMELAVRRQSAASTVLVDRVLVANADMTGLQARAESAEGSIRTLLARRKELDDELLDIERESEAIAQQRGSEFSKDVTKLEEERRLYVDRQRDALLLQGRLEADLKRDRAQLGLLQEKVKKVTINTTIGAAAKRRYELASAAARAAYEMLALLNTDMRSRIQQETDRIFKTFVWKDRQFQAVSLTDDYRLEVADRFDADGRSGLSAGERQVLSLSFIAGMSKVTGQDAPLVIDTPFGRLSETPVANIAAELPTITRQLVLFVTDREIDDASMAVLSRRIGKSYVLDFDDETGQTTIREVAA